MCACEQLTLIVDSGASANPVFGESATQSRCNITRMNKNTMNQNAMD
jgi:hypothetical protein